MNIKYLQSYYQFQELHKRIDTHAKNIENESFWSFLRISILFLIPVFFTIITVLDIPKLDQINYMIKIISISFVILILTNKKIRIIFIKIISHLIKFIKFKWTKDITFEEDNKKINILKNKSTYLCLTISSSNQDNSNEDKFILKLFVAMIEQELLDNLTIIKTIKTRLSINTDKKNEVLIKNLNNLIEVNEYICNSIKLHLDIKRTREILNEISKCRNI